MVGHEIAFSLGIYCNAEAQPLLRFLSKAKRLFNYVVSISRKIVNVNSNSLPERVILCLEKPSESVQTPFDQNAENRAGAGVSPP
jgi:hypothetical protein